jgi:hypothetical protein
MYTVSLIYVVLVNPKYERVFFVRETRRNGKRTCRIEDDC